MSACPPVDKLLAFASGELTDDKSAEVEGHIDSCAECRAALSNYAKGGPPPVLGRYRIDTVLGSGGMGIVYRAYDPQLARPVAIKVVRRAGEDEAGRARLIREAQALARLSHPNVCHVYDVGSEGDEVWVAMELIDGVSLRAWAEEHRDRDKLVGVLLGAAEGIAAAHAAGLVHRDIKPENVLVTRDGRAIVTDFGLARHEDAINPHASTLSNDPHLTATGAIAGTPAYLAPEQLLGDPIDSRVDQFAWAVMAYEMLTGSKPFPIIFAVRVEAIRQGLTPPASLPSYIANALVRAMAASPSDRFASMRELIAAMKAQQATVPRRGRAPAVAGLVVLGAGALVLGAWQLTKAGDEPKPVQVAAAKNISPLPNETATPPIPAAADAATAAPMPSPSPPSPTTNVAAPAATTNLQVPSPSPIGSAKKPKPTAKTDQAMQASVTPAPAPTGAGAGSNAQLTPRQQQILDSLDPPYCRSCAIASIDAFCEIPYDFTNPETSRKHEVVDWGKVTKVAVENGKLGDRPISLNIITVQGQRDTYRFKDELLVGRLETQVGALVAICPEEEDDFYQLSGGPTFKTRAVATLSAAPKMTDAAKYKALHIPDIRIAAAAVNKSLDRLDPNRRYLINAKVEADDGSLWKMDRYWLDASGAKNASRLAAKKRYWMIVEKPDFFESVPGDKRLVVHAVAILDDIFP
ncbi:MAG TPA: protein kinase [Kofleriaceae bacterium]|nr:protein kinase [Kofleriaceae bacterium]